MSVGRLVSGAFRTVREDPELGEPGGLILREAQAEMRAPQGELRDERGDRDPFAP